MCLKGKEWVQVLLRGKHGPAGKVWVQWSHLLGKTFLPDMCGNSTAWKRCCKCRLRN
jgi:hypothetical protein